MRSSHARPRSALPPPTPSREVLVRDLTGQAVFYLDGTSVARDDSGKPVATRTGTDAESITLADRAAAWMSGRPVLMDLGPADAVTPATQADYGISIAGECVADHVSPVRFVKHDRGYWFAENVGDATKLVVTSTGSDGTPAELNPGFSKTAFTTVGHAIAAKIPRLVADNADFDMKRRVLWFLVEKLRLLREYRVALQLTTAANWASANLITPVAKWNGGAGANPLTDLFAALAVSTLASNVLILPESAAPSFYTSAIQTFVQGGGQLPEVLVARSRFTTSGATAYTWAPTLPANVALVRVPPVADSLPSSVTFRWTGEAPDGEIREGILVRSFYDHRDDSHWFVCLHNDIEVQISNQIGALIVGALQ